jgi:hypothetical protein
MQSDRSRTLAPTGLFLLGCSATALLLIAALLIGGLDFTSQDTIINNHESNAQGLARIIAAMDTVPTISDDELETIFTALRTRAAEGDVQAARFVVELAKLQRGQPAPEDAGAAPSESPSN